MFVQEKLYESAFCPLAMHWKGALLQDNVDMEAFFGPDYLRSILREAQQMFDAVHIMAKAILSIQQRVCGDDPTLCDEFKSTFNGTGLYMEIYELAVEGKRNTLKCAFACFLDEFEPPLSTRLFYNNSYSGAPNYLISQLQDGNW